MTDERYPLKQTIFQDLAHHNKTALLLLMFIVLSAVATVWITHQTRLLTNEQSHLTELNQQLESQYTHLQLEENSQSQKSKVEAVAEKLGLQNSQKTQEIILVR